MSLAHNTIQEVRWTREAEAQLLGRRIVEVRYLTDAEMRDLAWGRKALALILDDGNLICPVQDDEGNGPGALFTNNQAVPVLPIL